MTRDPDDHATTSGRRRFIRNAGLVAGTAWVAPTVLSATPAAAGLVSPGGCAPTVSESAGSCARGDAILQVALPEGCPDVALAAAYSTDGGEFLTIGCALRKAIGISVGLGGETIQLRIQWLDTCGGTVIQEFLSPVYGPCEAGAPVDGDAPTTVTVTFDDGTTEAVTLP